MREYKNYMVMEMGVTEWMIANFNSYDMAVAFCNAYIPREADKLEVWGTDEDTDTFLDADTLYIRDLKKNTAVDLGKVSDKVSELASRLYDEEMEESYGDVVATLSTIDGCHDTIEYLLNTIDDILS